MSASVASASERGEIRGAVCTIVTREPKRANTCANSSPTGAAAEDDQRLGQLLEVECADVVDPVELVEARNGRDRGARAGRDQDPLGRQLHVADADRPRVDERRRSLEGLVALVAQVGDPAFLRLLQRLLPRVDRAEVRARGGRVEAELRTERAEVAVQLGGDEVRLRRLAGDVRTRTAPARALDEGDPRAELRRGLSAASLAAEPAPITIRS